MTGVTFPPPSKLPARLSPGDRVAVVSPSSWPGSRQDLDPLLHTLTTWGLRPEPGAHVADRRGYTAGTDADRLADLDEVLRDPGIRAVTASRGGCGSLRLVHGVDHEALERDPEPLVGDSDLTAVHQVWRRCGVPVIHGAVDGAHAEAVRARLMDATGAVVRTDPAAVTAEPTTTGTARGVLVGGNLEMLARCTGVVDTTWAGCLLLVEADRAAGLGMVDRAPTQLRLSGALDGLAGVAVGSFEEFARHQDRGWAVTDVLHDLLDDLGVPVLGGLPLGHLPDPVPVPRGVPAVLDADAGLLTVDAPVPSSPPAGEPVADPARGARW